MNTDARSYNPMGQTILIGLNCNVQQLTQKVLGVRSPFLGQNYAHELRNYLDALVRTKITQVVFPQNGINTTIKLPPHWHVKILARYGYGRAYGDQIYLSGTEQPVGQKTEQIDLAQISREIFETVRRKAEQAVIMYVPRRDELISDLNNQEGEGKISWVGVSAIPARFYGCRWWEEGGSELWYHIPRNYPSAYWVESHQSPFCTYYLMKPDAEELLQRCQAIPGWREDFVPIPARDQTVLYIEPRIAYQQFLQRLGGPQITKLIGVSKKWAGLKALDKEMFRREVGEILEEG